MTRAIVVLVVLALVSPLAAVTQAQTNAPPGNSAIDEYLETVPNSTGNTRPRPQAQGGAGGGLSPAARGRLEQAGPDGRALADAVDRTAPAKADRAPRSGVAGARSEGRSPAGEVLAAVAGDDGGGGMGVVLPAILIGALLAVLTLVLLRRRTTP